MDVLSPIVEYPLRIITGISDWVIILTIVGGLAFAALWTMQATSFMTICTTFWVDEVVVILFWIAGFVYHFELLKTGTPLKRLASLGSLLAVVSVFLPWFSLKYATAEYSLLDVFFMVGQFSWVASCCEFLLYYSDSMGYIPDQINWVYSSWTSRGRDFMVAQYFLLDYHLGLFGVCTLLFILSMTFVFISGARLLNICAYTAVSVIVWIAKENDAQLEIGFYLFVYGQLVQTIGGLFLGPNSKQHPPAAKLKTT